ncbi:MAG: hypothetical protein ACLSDM_01030 [Butyricicoccus sp.]
MLNRRQHHRWRYRHGKTVELDSQIYRQGCSSRSPRKMSFEDVSKYALVVHCGGCMLNEREMQYRLRHSAERNVPMTNYGIAIAHMHGILDRALAPFPDLHQAWSSTANG